MPFHLESPAFAKACAEAGITFVGPTVENLLRFSDKTSARQAAIEAGVPVVPGSDGALGSAKEVVEFVEGIGLPVILKVRRANPYQIQLKLHYTISLSMATRISKSRFIAASEQCFLSWSLKTPGLFHLNIQGRYGWRRQRYESCSQNG